MTDVTPRDVPPEVSQLLDAWTRKRGQQIAIHHVVGVTGIAASVAAASGVYQPSLCASVSTLCIAYLAFGNPRKEYGKFARAVRVLYTAVLRYRYHEIDRKALFNAVERGETLIQKAEADDLPSARQIQRAVGTL
jgi:hypothetical protein